MLPVSYEQAIFIARQHLEAGRISQAEDLCRRVLRDQPDRADAMHLLGVAASMGARHEQAIVLLRRATATDPTLVEAFVNLGNALREAGRSDDAIGAYREALSLNPQLAVAHAGIGDVFRRKGEMPQAIAAYQLAIELEPDIAEIHNNLGIALAGNGNPNDAIDSYRRAIELEPDFAKAHFNLGNAFRDRDELDEAIASYRRAVENLPDFSQAYSNLGSALKARGDVPAAVRAYDEAIRLSPEYPEPHWNRSLAFLIQGDFERGWAEYEWRHRCSSATNRAATLQWNGEDLEAKTILLHAEGGRGDTIQFVRYVPMVAALGARIVLECQPELCRLVSGLADSITVIPFGQPVPAFDVHCPLMSLPRVFGTRLETIPRDVPYLTPDPSILDKWKAMLGPANGRKRVGLVWAGRPEHQYDRARSMTLCDLAPLAQIEGFDFFSLQKGPASHQTLDPPIGMTLKDHTELLTDFAETAGLVSHLDLVITVDTAVAHLAAALGRPTWVMLAFAPDWRWLLDRSDSPWYPRARLFRQKSIGDWTNVVREVCGDLRTSMQIQHAGSCGPGVVS